MKKYVLVQENGKTRLTVSLADSFRKRLCGLMGVKGLEKKTGLLLVNCSGIHTCFMRFTIDAVYLDKMNKVLACETVSPWKMGSLIKGARHVLELPEGEGKTLIIGKTVSLAEEGRTGGKENE